MQPQSADQPSATPSWQYNQEGNPQTHGGGLKAGPKKAVQPISWTASEFVAHQKSPNWYILLALAGIGIAGLVFLLTRDFMSTGMVAVVMIILGVAAGRKPRTLQYQLDTAGVHIGEKKYSYNDFKAFSVIDEGVVSSIELLPLKRLIPSISIYYDPKDEDKITAILGAYLPFQEGQKDIFDRFIHRIRF